MMLQADLFEERVDESILRSGVLPAGLTYLPDFVSSDMALKLVRTLDEPSAANWIDDLSRRVQHFGYRYNYKLRALSAADKVPDPPDLVQSISRQLCDLGYFATVPDQVIVNEYLPGQGISPHVDRETCFGEAVASLSLCSDVIMSFKSPDGESGDILLRANSLVVLCGEARHRWQHGIAARRRDRIVNREFSRSRRLSLTFRTVVLDPKPEA